MHLITRLRGPIIAGAVAGYTFLTVVNWLAQDLQAVSLTSTDGSAFDQVASHIFTLLIGGGILISLFLPAALVLAAAASLIPLSMLRVRLWFLVAVLASVVMTAPLLLVNTWIGQIGGGWPLTPLRGWFTTPLEFVVAYSLVALAIGRLPRRQHSSTKR